MLRHTSIHTYNIPEETNLLSGYVLCVWGEHGRTRPLNTPGGAQRECRQPLFSTLRHAAHKHSCPSHGPFVPYRFVEVPVMDTVSLLWTFITDCSNITLLDKHSLRCMIIFQDYMALVTLESLRKGRQASETSHLKNWRRKTCICLPTQNYGKCTLHKFRQLPKE